MKEAERNMIHKYNNEHIVYQYELDQYMTPADIFKAFDSYKGTRYFFEEKTKDSWMIGIGHHINIILDEINADKVMDTYRQIQNTYHFHGLDKLYMRLFGGFQFDKGTNVDYSEFGHSHFIWPEIQFLFLDGRLIVSSCEQLDIHQLMERLNGPNTVHELPLIESIESIDEDVFLNNVEAAVEAMHRNEFEKVVLSRKKHLTLSKEVDAGLLISRAMQAEEQSYFVLLEQDNKVFISKTPEQLLKVEAGSFHTNAIAGTMNRAIDHSVELLLNDAKNLHEHNIVVNSILQDIEGIVSDITMPAQPLILENRYFYHLYTPIEGKLLSSNVLEMSLALHPTPALGGYPKSDASLFILENEGNRGFYGAPIGYIDSDCNGEFVVAIRSMLLENNKAVIYAGCGVVKDSQPAEELQETEIKFKPMMQLLGGSF